MLYVNVPITDPSVNLALEEYLFMSFPEDENTLMLWQNDNTVVVGRHQSTEEEVNIAFARENGILVVRRLTGGGAVFHDSGNLNFTFVRSVEDSKKLDFSEFTGLIVKALRDMGVNAQASGRNDISIDGKKCSGSAQTIREGRVLHHGTLLFDSNLDTMEKVLTVSGEKLDSKGVPSVKSRVTNISDHLSEKMTIEEFKGVLFKSLSAGQELKELYLRQEDFETIEKLINEKYRQWDWTFGGSPGYTVRKDHKFDSANVTIMLETNRGRIENIAIRGDFFATRDIDKLETRLKGSTLRPESLLYVLEDAGIDEYISGVTAQEIADLILN